MTRYTWVTGVLLAMHGYDASAAATRRQERAEAGNAITLDQSHSEPMVNSTRMATAPRLLAVISRSRLSRRLSRPDLGVM
jgi:hypothetical protein